ncbi:MAG TPA: hypothetical protein VGH91_05615 [Gammaproteobacteria bacterium]|jgi:hypothetical protein
MLSEEAARKQLEILYGEGSALVEEFSAEQRQRRKLYGEQQRPKKTVVVVIRTFSEPDGKERGGAKAPESPPPEKTQFADRYQTWYCRALPLMKALAPDRHAEFQSFYVLEPKYRRGGRPYVIQDYLRGRGASEAAEKTAGNFRNQLSILKAVLNRLAWSQVDTEQQTERGLQLGFLDTARKLMDTDERAAGALAGAILEGYLKKLAAKHRLRFRKLAPPLKEYIDALHKAKILDLQIHAQATWLAEIHDCSDRAADELPTRQQVRDLIDGSHWLITNVF